MFSKKSFGRALRRSLLLSSAAFAFTAAYASDFVNVGPAPIQSQTQNPWDRFSGAVTQIIADKTNPLKMYIGTANGGVWSTTNGGTTWTSLMSKQASLSIASLATDPADATGRTLVAGTGWISNGALNQTDFFNSKGVQAGLLVTKDGGTTWTQIGATTFAGQSVDAVFANGNTIVAGTFERTNATSTVGGLFRSIDGGATFTSISGTAGLGNGPVSSIVADPGTPTTLYAAVTTPDGTGAGRNSTAIYVSTNTGASWTMVFGTANAGGVINATNATQIQLATGPGGALAAGIVNVNTGQLTGVFLSKNGGTTWQTLPVPVVNPGGQGNTNFTLAIDPNNTNFVYVAGDSRQTAPYILTAFRIDAGTSTVSNMSEANAANNSSIHPDVRAMTFDANGQLIVSTDGGIFGRTQPQSDAGGWASLGGNLSDIETYAAVYGANSRLVAVSSQDNSAELQSTVGLPGFREILGGDGTVAVVNDTTLANRSVYYLSVQNLGLLRRLVVDNTGTIIARDAVNFTGAPTFQFSTPFVLNRIDPSLIAIGANGFVFVTQDTMTGATAPGTAFTLNLTQLGGGGGTQTQAIAYGTQDNTNALIAATGGGLFLSTSTAGGMAALPSYTGAMATSLVFDARTQNRFFATDFANLWGTTNRGGSFQSLTANLPAGFIRPMSLEYISNNGVNALLVGGVDNAANVQSTIAAADSDATGVLSNWRFFGSSLPNAQIGQMTYNPLADVLSVASYGRGAWLMFDVTSNFSQATVLQFGLADNDSTPDAALLSGNRPLIKSGKGTLLITGTGTYTGATTVNAGRLQVDGSIGTSNGVSVNNGAMLLGSGTVSQTTVNSGGTIAPGTVGTVATLSVNGTLVLANGSAFLVDKSPTANDMLSVIGAVTLGGTVTLSGVGGYAPKFGDRAVIASAPTINGNFATVTDNITGVLMPTVSIVNVPGGQQLVLAITAAPLAAALPTETRDQNTIAKALDTLQPDLNNNLRPVFAAIDPLTDGALGQGLEDLAPDVERAAPLTTDVQTLGFGSMLWQHLGDMAGAANGGDQASFRLDGQGLRLALADQPGIGSSSGRQLLALGMNVASAQGLANDAAPASALGATPAEAGANLFAMPSGSSGFLSGSSLSGSVLIGGGGGRADIRGYIIGTGLDFVVAPGLEIGGSFAVSQASTSLRLAPDTMQTDSLQGAIYARYDFDDHLIAEAFVGYGRQTISTRRSVVVGAATFNLAGHTGGDAPTVGLYLGRSYGVPLADDLTLTLVPSVGFQYLSANINAFTESGGAAAMTFAGYSESSANSRIGVDAKTTFDMLSTHVTPSAHLFWVNDFSGNNGSIQAAFAADPVSVMTFGIASRSRSYGELGVGADIDLGNLFGAPSLLTVRYDATAGRQDIAYDAWTGRLTVHF